MSLISHFFKREEFACKCGCGFDAVDEELLGVLEDVRLEFDKPVFINSGCRCPEHNKAEGGSKLSQHTFGKAADIRVKDVDADEVADYLEYTFPNSYGIGRYDGRTHIDVRDGKVRWDERKNKA